MLKSSLITITVLLFLRLLQHMHVISVVYITNVHNKCCIKNAVWGFRFFLLSGLVCVRSSSWCVCVFLDEIHISPSSVCLLFQPRLQLFWNLSSHLLSGDGDSVLKSLCVHCRHNPIILHALWTWALIKLAHKHLYFNEQMNASDWFCESLTAERMRWSERSQIQSSLSLNSVKTRNMDYRNRSF